MKFRDAIARNAKTIARLSDADLEALLPILKEARELTMTGMQKWLKKHEGDEKYTLANHRAMLASLTDAERLLKREAASALTRDLKSETTDAALKSLRSMKMVAEAAEKRFRDIARPLKLDEASILLDSKRALMGRHPGSAARYAGRQGEFIRKQLAVGLVRGDSVDAVVSRLIGKPQRITDRLSDADAAEGIADSGFFRSRADAERLVRTENIHAANAVQMDALRQENEDGEGGWLSRWDATEDSRTCDWCDEMDEEVRAPGEEFDDGVTHPPLHPNCRCSLSPWREGWKLPGRDENDEQPESGDSDADDN